jgi:hypothetical protein
VLKAAVEAGTDPEAPMKLAILENATAEGDTQQHAEVPIELTALRRPSTITTGGHAVKGNLTLEASMANILSHSWAVCSNVAEQDKVDVDYTTVSTSYDPLLLSH